MSKAPDAGQGPPWLADRSMRSRFRVEGKDRATFLHNLTTNEVKARAVGSGCEAFVTSPQGKTLGYILLHILDDSILVRSDPGGMRLVIPHFEKYALFDEVVFTDRTEATEEVHILGPGTDLLMGRLGVEPGSGSELTITKARVGSDDVLAIRESALGSRGWALIGPLGFVERLRRLVEPIGGTWLDKEAQEALRIEAGVPVFGKDVTENNLPQEIDRNAQTISFTKGCYLGQETVARLDALGHVNKTLRGLRFGGDTLIPSGAELRSAGKVVGTATSTARSLRNGEGIGLGMVRTTHAEPGTELVCELPGRSIGVRVVAAGSQADEAG